MRRINMIVVLALCTLLFASISSAQQTSTVATTTTASVPNLIRYSGTLKDAQGAALVSTAPVGVTFAIYNQQDGGAAVWQETQNVTPEANGQYSVILGSTTATGLPTDLFSEQEQRWLGVQVQGQSEQPRVLLVSVPYAFKAHEAETLGGRSVSDFVLANGANGGNGSNGSNSSQAALPIGNNLPAASGAGTDTATNDGPTNFSGSTTDQIVGVTQSGSGNAIVASTSNTSSSSNAVEGTISGPGVAIYGSASSTSAQAYGVQGNSASTIGIGLLGFATSTTGSTYGLKGYSSSTGGTGVRGLSTATTGSTTGISASVASAAGIAGVFNNTAGGKILSGQNNGVQKFSVDGSGNVNALGTFTGSGTGLTGIQFSNLGGSLASSQFIGTYTNAVTLSNTSNVFYGNGANLTGVVAGPGSPYYIQNGTSRQDSASFNISGSGSAGSFISGTTYQVGTMSGSSVVLSIGNDGTNIFVGQGAGSNTTGSGNAFTGYQAGYSNTTGSYNTFSGYQAGYSSNGNINTFLGYRAGYSNTTGYWNTFSGDQAGRSNTTGSENTFDGAGAGNYNTEGSYNTLIGYNAGSSNTTGNYNIFIGGGYYNTTGSNNIYIGAGGGTTESNTTYIAGIAGSTVTGSAVYVTGSGQLGVQTSSRRFKEQIADMGDSTNALMKLRPVSFLYKPEYAKGDRTLQYGLIAEEVAQVYPGLVAYDNDGKPYTVRYQYLAPMLLNEVQKQYRRAEEQSEIVATQQLQIKAQRQEIDSLKHELQLQNAALQERLSKLESYVATQTQMKTASDVQPSTTASPSGDSQ